ncbi:hypothetical protein [uncultured Helicobacter sp.]|uniref:hypothetical protein n=1 Tax=uncultured Helicobacter sp. TaxID=175537 RepID=UPI0025FD07F2|nr:hypothetical protein [uncultured Helicobacter sp.]
MCDSHLKIAKKALIASAIIKLLQICIYPFLRYSSEIIEVFIFLLWIFPGILMMYGFLKLSLDRTKTLFVLVVLFTIVEEYIIGSNILVLFSMFGWIEYENIFRNLIIALLSLIFFSPYLWYLSFLAERKALAMLTIALPWTLFYLWLCFFDVAMIAMPQIQSLYDYDLDFISTAKILYTLNVLFLSLTLILFIYGIYRFRFKQDMNKSSQSFIIGH